MNWCSLQWRQQSWKSHWWLNPGPCFGRLTPYSLGHDASCSFGYYYKQNNSLKIQRQFYDILYSFVKMFAIRCCMVIHKDADQLYCYFWTKNEVILLYLVANIKYKSFSFVFQSDVIFLTCGHVCCCHTCARPVRQCPMCRATISQQVRIYTWFMRPHTYIL